MREIRGGTLGIALGAVAWWLVSCRDIPAPEGGILAVSGVLLPSPGLVAGDTMRDSLGLAAPLRIVAYQANGEPAVPAPIPTFVVLDTGAHLADAFWLVGDKAGTTVRVVGSVGSLQTSAASVKVTLSADTLVANDSIVHHKTYSLVTGDTVVNSAELTTVVEHRGATGATNTGVEAVIVRYTIDKMPAGNGKGPTLLLMSGSTLATRDTTDASGRASRVARLRLAALNSTAPETTAVSATASYRGRTLGVVQFTVIFKSQ